MKCKLDGENASLLAKAIQSLGKFGSNLYVEADDAGLQLRTINATHSAAGRFRFKRSFFTSFKLAENEECYCRISMKACLAVFRSMRQVEHCEIQVLVEESQFHVKLKCHLDTQKNAVIYVVEDENITTAASPDDTSNIIYGSYKLFNEISNIFNTTEEEITFEVKKEHLTAKNYIEGARIAERFMCTQLKLGSNEFEKYDINLETIITFCLKEFRAFLHFAEAINANITLNFEDSGSPIFMFIEKPNDIECQLIMSTLASGDVSYHENNIECDLSDADLIAVSESLMSENSILSVVPKCIKATEKQEEKEKKPARKRKHKSTDGSSESTDTSKARRIAEQTTLTANDSLFNFDNSTTQRNTRSRTAAPSSRILTVSEEDNNKVTTAGRIIDAALGLLAVDEENRMHAELSEPQLARMSPLEEIESHVNCEIIPSNNKINTKGSDLSVTFYNTEDTECTERQQAPPPDNDKDCIPQSPQNNKIRSIFKRCFEATYQPTEPTTDSQIYVPNSDSE